MFVLQFLLFRCVVAPGSFWVRSNPDFPVKQLSAWELNAQGKKGGGTAHKFKALAAVPVYPVVALRFCLDIQLSNSRRVRILIAYPEWKVLAFCAHCMLAGSGSNTHLCASTRGEERSRGKIFELIPFY